MKIEKINLNEAYYTPDSEKDSLESAHISGDEVTLVKNEKKIIEHERTKEIAEHFEASDLLPSKEGVHIDKWKGSNRIFKKYFENSKKIIEDKGIKEARNKTINTKAA